MPGIRIAGLLGRIQIDAMLRLDLVENGLVDLQGLYSEQVLPLSYTNRIRNSRVYKRGSSGPTYGSLTAAVCVAAEKIAAVLSSTAR